MHKELITNSGIFFNSYFLEAFVRQDSAMSTERLKKNATPTSAFIVTEKMAISSLSIQFSWQ